MVMNSSKTDVSDGGANLSPKRRRVGLLYDHRMCKHFDAYPHPENPNRILSIWDKLQSSGINQRCILLNAKEAEDKTIALVHTKKHIDRIKSISSPKFDLRRNRIAASFNSIYFNEGSSEAAYLAAGSVVEVAEKVAKGELDYAFAIVRPPGHHAETNEPMGFCLYNNVAIAASYLLNERTELGINKILIVDWDVHHGNGTQKMFWKDSRVLFFSVHRHEFGSFYPGGDDGSYEMIGEGPGAGYNINVPWENHSCGDADYLAVWNHVLIPVAKAFDPGIIIISAGFDAAIDDPLGGCCVSPYGYSIMLSKLMEFAGGKIVMALEGGYNLASLANSALACVEVLLDHKPVAGSLGVDPLESTWRVIQMVREQLSSFWPTLRMKLPEDLTHKRRSPVLVASPDSDGEFDNGPHSISEDLATTLEQVIQPLHNLKVEDGQGRATSVSPSWRSELSKIDIWHATYGSNMRESRLLCYIEVNFDLPFQLDTGSLAPQTTSEAAAGAEATSMSSAAPTSTTALDEALQAEQRAKRRMEKAQDRKRAIEKILSPRKKSKGKGLETTDSELLERSTQVDLVIAGDRRRDYDVSLHFNVNPEKVGLKVEGDSEMSELYQRMESSSSGALMHFCWSRWPEMLMAMGLLNNRLQEGDSALRQEKLRSLGLARQFNAARRELAEVTIDRDMKVVEMSRLNDELAQVKGELEMLKSQQINPGELVETAVSKLVQTKGFSAYATDLCTEAVKVGQALTLNSLGGIYPQLGLRRKKMGWHPKAREAAKRYYTHKVKSKLPRFELVEHLKARTAPITLEYLQELTVDYDDQLDAFSEPLEDFEDLDRDPSEVH